jgi:hypothetical protein
MAQRKAKSRPLATPAAAFREGERLAARLLSEPHFTNEALAEYGVLARRAALTMMSDALAEELLTGYMQDRHDDVNVLKNDTIAGAPITITNNKMNIQVGTIIVLKLYQSIAAQVSDKGEGVN